MDVVVAGGGRVGTYLASLLLQGGHRVKIVESRQEEKPRLLRELPEEAVMISDSTDPGALESAGIRQADVVVAVTDRDERNLVITNLARFEFGVPRVIARVNDPRNAWMFTPEMGVDVCLNQAELMSRLVAEEMSLGDMMTLLKLKKGQVSLVEVKVEEGAPVVQKSVSELGLPPESVLVSVIRGGELIIPRGSTVLHPNDEVLALVHASQTEHLAAFFRAAP